MGMRAPVSRSRVAGIDAAEWKKVGIHSPPPRGQVGSRNVRPDSHRRPPPALRQRRLPHGPML